MGINSNLSPYRSYILFIHIFLCWSQLSALFPYFAADSGRYSIIGSSKCHTARLSAGEKILRRYVADPSTVEVIDEFTLLFKMQSTSTAMTWYHISIQSSYCDCPDWTSECKHLYGLRLIIQEHFPHLRHVLPIVDSAHALGHNLEEASISVDEHIIQHEFEDTQSQVASLDEKIAHSISSIKRDLQDVESDLPNYSVERKEELLRELMGFKLFVPKQIDLPLKGSIRQIQAHVTETRLGHRQPREVNQEVIDANLISDQPQKRVPATGVLRKKHQRGRSRVRFEKRPRIHCPHCCSKTLLVDPREVISCHTCHSLLPLSRRHAPPLDCASLLVNRVIKLIDDVQVQTAIITACEYGPLEDDERTFTLTLSSGNQLEQIKASTHRLVLVFTT